MKRVIALVLSCSMVVLALTGCGGEKPDPANDVSSEQTDTAPGQTGESSEDGEDSGEEENLIVHEEISGTVSVGINSYRNSDFEAVCEAFRDQYPNVKVNPILFESKSDDATEYLTAQSMAGKTLPDIMYDDAGSLPTYIQNGWMYPLTAFVEGDEEFEELPEVFKDRFIYGGNLYALGQTITSNVLIVNTELVEDMNIELPEYNWDWDDFTDFIKACTNSEYSGVEDLSNQYNWVPGTMTEGRTIIGYDYENGTFDVESVRKFVNYYSEISRLGGVEATSLKQNASSGESDYVRKFGNVSGSDAAFTAGKVACAFTGTWAYASWSQKELPFEWDLYPVPQCVSGRVPIHVDYCWMTTSVEEENLEAAWAFLRFVTYSKEGNLARLTTYDEDHITSDMYNKYYIPCTVDEEVGEKFKSLPYVTDAIIYIYDNMDNGYMGDPEKLIPGFEAVEYPIIGKIAYESICGQYDFTSRMNDAQTRANQEIQEYREVFEEALAKFEADFEAAH